MANEIKSAPVLRYEVNCGHVRASLSYYSSRSRQLRHRHEYTQISFLLAGAVAERIGADEYELDGPAMGCKPAGVLHDDEWGTEGALIFSLKVPPRASERPYWSKVPNLAAVGLLARACLLEPAEASRRDAALDLLALTFTEVAGHASTAPPWLRSAKEALSEGPAYLTVAEVAKAAGVDRAHFSRKFQHHFGMSPSLFRQRCLAGRAVVGISRSRTPLAAIAAETGYCDQAHLNRSVKSHTGMTPGALRGLLAKAHHIHPRPGPF